MPPAATQHRWSMHNLFPPVRKEGRYSDKQLSTALDKDAFLNVGLRAVLQGIREQLGLEGTSKIIHFQSPALGRAANH